MCTSFDVASFVVPKPSYRQYAEPVSIVLQWGDGVHAAIVSVGVANFCLLQLLISSVLVGCY